MPGLLLRSGTGEKPLTECAGDLFAELEGIAGLLDAANRSTEYSHSLRQQAARIAEPELTPSARILREMREKELPFFRLVMAYSEHWAGYFRKRALSPSMKAAFEEESRRSLEAQREIERSDTVGFEEYLDRYFAQYRAL
jgi:glutamate--cysteine ligase